MTNTQSVESFIGKNAVDAQGDKIGSIKQVYVNDTTGDPDWITVNTGLFGMKEHFAPLQGSSFDGDNLVLPFDKDVVKDSPDVADTEHLDADESDALYRYYQQYLGAAGSYEPGTDTEYVARAATDQPVTAAGGGTDGYLTRSEEQLHVGTEEVEAGRAKLRKYVVTEQQTVTVPVSHDQVKVVREPLQPGDSLDGATIGEDSIEVTLMEDKVLVNKDVVGVEKVKLATEQVTEQQEVTESVRKEQIELVGDAAAGSVPASAGTHQ